MWHNVEATESFNVRLVSHNIVLLDVRRSIA